MAGCSKLGMLTAVTALLAAPLAAGEVRMMWYSDGVEGEVMADLLDRFMAEHPDIAVTLDTVPYQTIKEQLPVQLAAGQGPDIARMTDIKALAEHFIDLTPHLRDPDGFRDSFGAQLDWMRPDGSDIIPGFMTQLTLTGGFVNETLFQQAGVALPGEDAGWAEWVAAAGEVQDSQQLPAAVAIDRSGHRIAGPMLNEGARFIGAEGDPLPMDDAARRFIAQLVEWTDAGRNFRDVWVSAAGTTYRPAVDEFINAQVPFYYAGSWQVANLATTIGDAFDWQAVGTPCGPDGCSGVPGGAALVGLKYTQNPQDVATVLEWLAQEDIVREFSERTLFLPAHRGVIEAGNLAFQTEDASARAALDAFVAASAKVTDAAAELPAWVPASDVYAALAQRISEAMAGELSLEDAYARIDSDIAEAQANRATD